MILAIRLHGSESYLKVTRRHLFGLYFFVSVGFLAFFVNCCSVLAVLFITFFQVITYNCG